MVSCDVRSMRPKIPPPKAAALLFRFPVIGKLVGIPICENGGANAIKTNMSGYRSHVTDLPSLPIYWSLVISLAENF